MLIRGVGYLEEMCAGGLNPNDSFLHDYYDSGSKVKATLGAIALVASKSKVTEVARIGEFASVPLFLSAEVMDYYAWKGGEISGAKALLNLGMGFVGFTEIGAPVSAAYFAGDAFIPGGWSGLGNSISNGVNDTLDQLKQGVSQYNNIYQWVPHQ